MQQEILPSWHPLYWEPECIHQAFRELEGLFSGKNSTGSIEAIIQAHLLDMMLERERLALAEECVHPASLANYHKHKGAADALRKLMGKRLGLPDFTLFANQIKNRRENHANR